MRICRRCSEEVPEIDFPHAEKLDGFDPWCNACRKELQALTGDEYKEALVDWKRDRMWAYIKARRVRLGMAQRTQYSITGSDWTAKIFVQRTADTAQLRIRCKWSRKDTVRDKLLVGACGIDPLDVTLAGRGGGRGYREQPIAELRCEMLREQWERVLGDLRKELTVQEVRA